MRTPDRGETLLQELLNDFTARPRPVQVVAKRGVWHPHLADKLLRFVTLGGQGRYLSHYVTTLGHTIYVPEDWGRIPPLERYVVLRHEAVHVRQFERWGWGAMVLIYGLFPLPIGLAWGRARLEWEAYAETLRATAQVHGPDAARSERLHAEIVARFTGPDYAWMWPFPSVVRRWIRRTLEEMEHEGLLF